MEQILNPDYALDIVMKGKNTIKISALGLLLMKEYIIFQYKKKE